MKPYSLDLRERIVAAVTAGQSRRDVAERFAVSSSTVGRYLCHSTGRESLAPKVAPGAARKIPAPVEQALSERVAAMPGATVAQHRAWLKEEHGVEVSPATAHRAVRRLGFTHKKSVSSPANATRTSGAPSGKPSRAWYSKN
jgi:transposase